MTVKKRINALRYLEMQNRNPDYANKLGIAVKLIEKRKREEIYEK